MCSMQEYWWKRNNFHRRGAEAQGRRRGNGVLNICIDEQLELDFNQRLKLKNEANILMIHRPSFASLRLCGRNFGSIYTPFPCTP